MGNNINKPVMSDAAAAELIRKANDNAFTTAAKFEQAGMRNVLGAKQAQVANAVKSASGGVLDATSKFISSSAGLMTNMTLARKGASASTIRQQKDEADKAFKARQERDNQMRPAMAALANGGNASRLIDASNDALSQSFGGQSMINAAKVADAEAQSTETASKMTMDAFKDGKEHASKAQDSVTDFIKGNNDRLQQTLMNLAGRI